MKLTVEKIMNTNQNKTGFKTVMVRREVLASEKSSGSSKRRRSFLGTSQFERTGRTALFNMSDEDIAKFGIKVGADLNVAVAEELGEQAVQVLESTDKDEFGADIALGMSEKINPSDDTAVTHNGQQIWHCAILTSAAWFAEDGGDITLAPDQTV